MSLSSFNSTSIAPPENNNPPHDSESSDDDFSKFFTTTIGARRLLERNRFTDASSDSSESIEDSYTAQQPAPQPAPQPKANDDEPSDNVLLPTKPTGRASTVGRFIHQPPNGQAPNTQTPATSTRNSISVTHRQQERVPATALQQLDDDDSSHEEKSSNSLPDATSCQRNAARHTAPRDSVSHEPDSNPDTNNTTEPCPQQAPLIRQHNDDEASSHEETSFNNQPDDTFHQRNFARQNSRDSASNEPESNPDTDNTNDPCPQQALATRQQPDDDDSSHDETPLNNPYLRDTHQRKTLRKQPNPSALGSESDSKTDNDTREQTRPNRSNPRLTVLATPDNLSPSGQAHGATTQHQRTASPNTHHEGSTHSAPQQQPSATDKMITAKAWKELFDKLRYCRPTPTHNLNNEGAGNRTIQQIILPQADNNPIGDTMNDASGEPNNFRIYSQNVNGLNAGRGTGKWEGILEMANTNNVSIMGLSETNTEWNNYRLTSRLKAKLRKHSNHGHMTHSTSSIKVSSYYKPGGTATIALNKWSGRITNCITDTSGQGRWSGFILRARKPIVVITAYRVPQSSIDNVGYKTAYAQQWAVARMAGEQQPEPRGQTTKDLTSAIKQWQQTQDIILMIDANEHFDSPQSAISKLAASCNLVDIIATRHQQATNTATYSRGTKRIDFILISENIAPAVTRCGLLPFYEGIHSDHRGSFIDLDARILFQDRTPQLYEQPRRQLHSKKPSAVMHYKTELWKQLTAHNIINRSTTIAQRAIQDAKTSSFAQELNNIANIIQQAMLSAEASCPKSPNTPYSTKMANLNKIIRYWKTKKSEIKTKRDATPQLQQIQQELPKSYQAKLVQTFSIQTHIRKAVSEYNKEIPNAKEHRQEQIYDWAEAAAKRGDKTVAQHIRSMAQAEDSKETFRILKNIIKPQDRSGLKKLDVPATSEDGQPLVDALGNTILNTIGDPTKVEQLLIDRNKQHFGQAQGTPFTTQQMTDTFGLDGEGQATDDLILGILPNNIDDMPPTVQTILRKIAEHPPEDYINADVDAAQLTMMYKHWK